MPLDPGRLADTAAWLAKARQDLEAATVLLAASPALLGAAAFHCQQATEKSFKAFLAWHDQPFRKTHSLEELGRQVAVLDAALEPVVDRTVALTEYAWKFRYPGEPAEPTREEADAALRLAREVYHGILGRLPAEAQP